MGKTSRNSKTRTITEIKLKKKYIFKCLNQENSPYYTNLDDKLSRNDRTIDETFRTKNYQFAKSKATGRTPTPDLNLQEWALP